LKSRSHFTDLNVIIDSSLFQEEIRIFSLFPFKTGIKYFFKKQQKMERMFAFLKHLCYTVKITENCWDAVLRIAGMGKEKLHEGTLQDAAKNL
jgi:hypothetical protein